MHLIKLLGKELYEWESKCLTLYGIIFLYKNEYKVHPELVIVGKLVFSGILDTHVEAAEQVTSALLYFKCNKCQAACFHVLF